MPFDCGSVKKVLSAFVTAVHLVGSAVVLRSFIDPDESSMMYISSGTSSAVLFSPVHEPPAPPSPVLPPDAEPLVST
jgi:hypothetical protein